MASNTSNLDLLKKDPLTDGDDTFNIEAMLNDNWDKIDAGYKENKDNIGDKLHDENNYIADAEDLTASVNKLDKQLLIASTALDEDTSTLYEIRLVQVDGKPVLRTEEVV